MSYINIGGELRHIPKFGGEMWFVSKTGGSDSNSGTAPDGAFETIGAAITACAAGDAINIKAGTYVEDSILLNKNAVELWGEIGVVITPAGATTCLQVTGNSCRIRGIKTSKASQIGFDIDGAGCMLEDCEADDNTIAYDIDGAETIIVRCRDHNASVTGFDIATAENLLYLCSTIGDTTSRGFYLSHANADSNMLYQCVSTGNQTAGYEIITGCANNVIAYCVSGGGDGARVDADEINVWANYAFDNTLSKDITLSIGGGGATDEAYNLFKVTGTVKINSIVGIVETALTGSNTDCFLDVYSANGSVRLSKDNQGVTLGAAIVGSVIARLDSEDKVLSFASAAGAKLMDEIDAQKEGFRLIEDRTGAAHVATYIRFVHTGAAACTGEIDWYVEWEPVSDDGFLASV